MLTCRDSQARVEVVDDGEDGRLPLEGYPIRGNETHQRQEDDERGTQPIDVLVPVAPCHGLLRDVRLLGVVLVGRPQRLVVGGAIRYALGHARGSRRR